MGQVIQLKNYRHEWRELISLEDSYATIHVFMDEKTGELDITLINDEGECVRIALPTVESIALGMAIHNAHEKLTGK